MKKEFNRLTGKFILVSIVLILLSIPIMAENDPGHDTLYIEELGDSELNGSLNITNNLTVDGGKIKQAGTLTLYSDGTMPETGNYISGTGSDLYIDSSGSLYLKWNIGGNQVYIGKAGAGAVALNVSGALYVQSGTATIAGVNICLENGTNCPGGGIGDISGVYGDNIYIYNGSASGEVTLLLNETKLNATISAKITAGSGNISGAGTSGTLAKFTADGTIANSIVSESGNTLTVNGNISMPTNFYIGNSATASNTSSLAIGDQAQATGLNSLAIGHQAQVTNSWSMAIGDGAQATGSDAVAVGASTQAIGGRSIALGRGAITNDAFSVAVGDSANASQYSTAVGYGAQTGSYATAYGRGAKATATGAVALGTNTNASGTDSLAVGGLANATATYAVSIGHQASSTATNAYAIGYLAQATASDAFAFGTGVVNNIANSSKFGGAVIVVGDVNVTSGNDFCIEGGTCLSTAGTGSGNLSARGATAGTIPQFQNGSIVNNSIISQSGNTLTINGNISMPTNFWVGYGAEATGQSSIALGYLTKATANSATAIGDQAIAAGLYSTAVGIQSNASYQGSTAIGQGATALNDFATALGDGAKAGYLATAVGILATATNSDATALGYLANASALDSIALGYNTRATAAYSAAIGSEAQATAQDAFAFGRGVVNNVANSSKFGGAVYVNGNISQNDNYYHCFGDSCDAYMYFNGTSLIIKVN